MDRKFLVTRPPGKGLLLILTLLLSLPLLSGATALAQGVLQGTQDGALQIVRSTEEFLAPEAIYGTVHVVPKAADGENALIYFPPGKGEVSTDVVTYKLAGKPDEIITVKVDLRGEPGAFGSTEIYNESFKAVFILFILAVLVESGLQLIFRWRPYMRVFNTSSSNALIAFAFALTLVVMFHLDVVTNLFNIYTRPVAPEENTIPGYILTAMIIAGGSAGVNRILRALGFRPIEPPAEIAGPTREDQAWISVMLTRKNATGPVDVMFGKEGELAVIGTIAGQGRMNALSSLFLRNRSRFPSSGGYAVPVGGPYMVRIKTAGVADPDDPPDSARKSEASWGPNLIGNRAIIDLNLTL
ncbi:hypothetical protein [Labrenzia sp. 011]|uniref:hypothetical protein n=1 Tax=Labrenzia sp. 011 TaxID=2171494 RepID=UPI000D509BFC|nr:hypothetical protein [Labrenzia sp. 011]PVB61238.1 hypothetical protein DCO57_13555 [Labrenzia sp. 011]